MTLKRARKVLDNKGFFGTESWDCVAEGTDFMILRDDGYAFVFDNGNAYWSGDKEWLINDVWEKEGVDYEYLMKITKNL